MEMLYYKCDKCGYMHQQPSYWSGHSNEAFMEMEHLNLKTKEMCEELILKLVKE